MFDIFSTEGFVPRTQCGPGWSGTLIAIHRLADLLIFFAYIIIPILVVWRVRQGLQAIPRTVSGIFLLTGFVATCGLTHLSNQFMFIWPAYKVDAILKASCAIFSIACGMLLTFDGMKHKEIHQ